MKRLIIFCTSSGWGGTEKNALLRASEFQKRNYTVQLILSGDLLEEKAKKAKLDYKRIKRGGDLNPLSIYRYYSIIKKFNADIVFLTLVKDYWLGSLASYLNKISSTFLYLGIERIPKRSLKYYLIYKHFTAGMIVNSPEIKRTFLEHSNLFKSNDIKLIRNGFQSHSIDRTRKNILKDSLNLSENDILIGAAGRLTEQKGFDLIPKLMEKLSHIENLYIAVAGEGEERKKIEKDIQERKLEDRIFLLGFQSDLSDFYRNIDLFLLSSRYEGMANVLNEAMSYGNPVISTRVSGVEELLLNGKLGDIVAIDDLTSLAESIQSYLERKVCVKDEKYIQHIETYYSIKKMIDETEAFFLHEAEE